METLSLGSREVPYKIWALNLGRISSAVLTFNGYKLTDRKIDMQRIYIDILPDSRLLGKEEVYKGGGEVGLINQLQKLEK